MPHNHAHIAKNAEYYALSVKDLLEARDAYHVFLTRKKNVVGTAVGKYRFRHKNIASTEARTLKNSETHNNSWPCVLVFVKEWLSQSDFSKADKDLKNQYLPKELYLPDGREIPVCVIQADWQNKNSSAAVEMKYPGSVVGGGYPIFTKIQGQERWATLGCLVTDGRLTYGLTNAHVTGRPGDALFTMKNGNEQELGASSEKQLKKMPFPDVYEGFPGKHSLVNLDIGLIEFNDLNEITSQIYGIGELGGLADINHDTLTLNLIDCPVKGYGCASGIMEGQIAGLFYRYTSLGGYDFVADYLIGPRRQKKEAPPVAFAPRRGDSGTLLVIDEPHSKKPKKAIGLLWGGQHDTGGNGEEPYGLVTNLGTICRMLDVSLVCGWNTGYDNYFGAYAHIVLPSLCVDVLQDRKLMQLMSNNADNISMPLGDTAIKDTKGLSKADFVPLADVADLVWKKRGGAYCRPHEGPNHFADMDQPAKHDSGRTLLEPCEDPENIDPAVWLTFYQGIGAKEKGALPFRIQQIYEEMVRFAEKGEASEFVCAAGILSHYVFDAAMPLHISYMHHGDPDGPMKTVIKKDKEKQMSIAYGVHDEFDNQMVEYHVEQLSRTLPGLVEKRKNVKIFNAIDTPKDAAIAAVTLMRTTVTAANPEKIVRDYELLADTDKRSRCEALWKKYGRGMQQAIADAVVLTGMLWEAAWKNGNGKQNIKSTSAIPQDALKELYETKEGFLDSIKLEDMVDPRSGRSKSKELPSPYARRPKNHHARATHAHR